MQSDVNGLPSRLGVVGVEIQERIKRRGWIGVQQRLPQARLTDFANGQVLPLVSGVTETGFPVPRLEIIAKFAHLTLEPDVKELVPVSEFFASWTGVVDTAEPNTGSYRETGAIRKEVWNSRICNRKRIKRIRERHADTGRAKEGVSARILECVGRKRYRCQGCIEKRADIFEIGKHRQVFVAQVARERTVISLAIRRRQRRRESREVKAEVVAASLDIREAINDLGLKSRNGIGILIKWRM